MNPNIQKIIDATPKGEGGKWISIHQAELMITQAVLEAASIARHQTLTHSGVRGEFSGTVVVETVILDHFGVEL